MASLSIKMWTQYLLSNHQKLFLKCFLLFFLIFLPDGGLCTICLVVEEDLVDLLGELGHGGEDEGEGRNDYHRHRGEGADLGRNQEVTKERLLASLHPSSNREMLGESPNLIISQLPRENWDQP